MNETGTGGLTTDLTGDGVVDDADRDLWLADAGTKNGFDAPYLVGDGNLDGAVDVEIVLSLEAVHDLDQAGELSKQFADATRKEQQVGQVEVLFA